MAGPIADALRDALDGLSTHLDSLIDALPQGNPVRRELETAQNSIEDASSSVDAQSIEALLTNSADLKKIKDLTTKINASAAAIAASQANVTKIVAIGDKALALGTAVAAGGVPGILSAAAALQGAIG